MISSERIANQSAHTLGQAFLATRPLRVLLAEDNVDMLDMLEGALRRDGYQVTSVSDGQDLLAAIQQRPAYGCLPELIISDVRMPGLSGLQVVARLRETDCTTPVILISAFGDVETHAQAERLGATLLDKPFLLEELRQAAREQSRRR